jgi:hypothetical protein
MKLPIQIPSFKKKAKPGPLLKPGQKLQATARRSSAAMADDYEEEPTMRLSSALFVVLILHVVAIVGVMAFTKFKESHARAAVVKSDPLERQSTAQPVADVTQTKPKPAAAVAKADSKKPDLHSAASTLAVKDSGEFYTVVRGDNPVTIARHLKVKYDDLIALNHIDDPRHLQIGQKLHVPVKAKAHETAAND